MHDAEKLWGMTLKDVLSANWVAHAKADRRETPNGLEFDYFDQPDGIRLRYARWANTDQSSPRGTVVFLPGRTEFIEKFYEDMTLVHYLGFATAAMDLRGQGGSTRPFGDQNKHELESFDPHIADVAALLARLQADGLPKPFVLMAHSAGSHVTLRVLHDHGDQVAGAVTVAPMVAIASGKIPGVAARLLPRLMVSLGLGSNYVPGHSVIKEGLWGWRKQLTHDDDRFRDEDHFTSEKDAGLAVGGATFRWVDAANRSCSLLSSPGYGEAIKPPVLIIRAGKDTIVSNSATAALAARIPNATLVTIEGAMHEILKETDELRAEAWAHILLFLNRIAPVGPETAP